MTLGTSHLSPLDERVSALTLRPNSKSGKLPGEADTKNNPGYKRATDKRAEVARTKAKILELRAAGHTVDDACRLAGKQPAIWKYYRNSDPEFAAEADLIYARQIGKKIDRTGEEPISFEEFSEKYLNSKRFRHQMQWIDLIEVESRGTFTLPRSTERETRTR